MTEYEENKKRDRIINSILVLIIAILIMSLFLSCSRKPYTSSYVMEKAWEDSVSTIIFIPYKHRPDKGKYLLFDKEDITDTLKIKEKENEKNNIKINQ